MAAGRVAGSHPAWKRRRAPDRGATGTSKTCATTTWATLYGVDPVALRAVDPDRYLDLGRSASATDGGGVQSVATARFGLRGAVGARGPRRAVPAPVPACRLRRPIEAGPSHSVQSRPVALLASDEGMNGLDVWALNDTAEPVCGVLTVAVSPTDGLRRPGRPRPDGRRRVPRASAGRSVLGAFLDVTYAYRFGAATPRVVSPLHWRDGDRLLGRALFHLPVGSPTGRNGVIRVSWRAQCRPAMTGVPIDVTESERYAHFVQVECRRAESSISEVRYRARRTVTWKRSVQVHCEGVFGRSTGPNPRRSRRSRAEMTASEPNRFGSANPDRAASACCTARRSRTVAVWWCATPSGSRVSLAYRPFRHLADRLTERGFTVLRLDYSGHR